MANNPTRMNLDTLLSTLRNEVLLAQAKSQEKSLAAFDMATQHIQQLTGMLQDSDKEVKRLRELCEKNNIDTKISTEKQQ
ncbi:MAG: hypothetical protein J4F36_07800 [Nitrosopumilaceae archaeon]|nr:hypothetical protein [Nitrosopumilaceae archaeon]